ncbi:MAG: hypothetical protein OQK75_02795 [Gammaproteobacteria bacterium]|nr:hypothetical protein [Gammaproteobacteria bacterium]MCW8986576.1 hypothetical protein [Gammaproteobacteria bacterium]
MYQEKAQEYESNDVNIYANKMHPLFYLIFVIELLMLPLWWIAVVFSIPGTGLSWQYYLTAGPTVSYPALIIICFIWCINIKNDDKQLKHLFVSLLPVILALGWPLFQMIIFG